MREPAATVANRRRHIGETVEVVSVPDVEIAGASGLAAHAEIGDLGTGVPTFNSIGLGDTGDDLVVTGRTFEGANDLGGGRAGADRGDPPGPCFDFLRCLRAKNLHLVLPVNGHLVLPDELANAGSAGLRVAPA